MTFLGEDYRQKRALSTDGFAAPAKLMAHVTCIGANCTISAFFDELPWPWKRLWHAAKETPCLMAISGRLDDIMQASIDTKYCLCLFRPDLLR